MSNIVDIFTNPDSAWKRAFAFNEKQKRRTYQKLGQMVRNGLTVPDAIDRLSLQAKEAGTQQTVAAIMDRWKRSMLDGESFSQAASSDLAQSDVILLRAGETSGNLDRAVVNILRLWDAKKRMKGAIVGGLAYPIVLILFVFILMAVVALFVVPNFDAIVPKEKWTGMAASLATGSWLIVNFGPLLLLFVITFVAVSVWSLPRWTGSSRLSAEKFIPWSLYKIFLGTGFLIAVSGLVREGVKTNNALEIVMTNGSPWYRERITSALRRMEDGEKLATALHRTGFEFPDKDIVDDLRIYENLDSFDEMLEILGSDALESSLATIQGKMKNFMTISLLVVAVFIIWFYMGFATLLLTVGNGGQ